MRHPALVRLIPLVGYLLIPPAAARAADTSELDQYEEKALSRSTERAVRQLKSDRVVWVKALEEAFPNKVGNPLKEDEYGAWFDLLVGKAPDWRRDGVDKTPLAELFDKVIQRLELGPVPSVKRDEFLRYARRVLVPANPASGDAPDPNEDADRVFRVLDRDADGVLAGEELTTKLRGERRQADADANGRIDKDEYRGYYRQRVGTAAEAVSAAKTDDRNGRKPDGKSGASAGTKDAFTVWLAELDTDKDGQVALHEWRRGGRVIDAFTVMDLDGDGLLTKDESERYAKMKEKEQQPPPG